MGNQIKVYVEGSRTVMDLGDNKPQVLDLDAKVDETHVNDGDAINGQVTLFNKRDLNQSWKCGFGDLLDGTGTTVGATKALILAYLSTVLAVSTERTPTLTRTTGDATITAGARSVSFFNSGAADDSTVLGTILKQGETVSFNAGGEGDTLSAIVYDAVSS